MKIGIRSPSYSHEEGTIQKIKNIKKRYRVYEKNN